MHRPQLTNCLATRGGELSLKVYLELDSDLITITILVTMILMMMIMTKLIVNSMTILIIWSPMLILSVFLKPARNSSNSAFDSQMIPSQRQVFDYHGDDNDRNNDHHDHSKFCVRCSNILPTQRIVRRYVMKSAP